MKNYPQFPNDWDDASQTLYRRFELKSTPDIEYLIRLVKEGIPNRGNDGVLRARLLGILYSLYWQANAIFWTKHEHPKTWRIRMFLRRTKEWYHRTFNTRRFKSNVEMCNIAREVANRIIKENNYE